MNNNLPLDLNADGAGTVDPTKKINLFGTQNNNSLPHQEDLATKYDYALGELSPGYDGVLSAIREGTLDRYNELVARQKDIEAIDARNAIVSNIAQQGVNDPIAFEIVRGLSEEQMQAKDIGAILEEEYAKKITNLQAVAKDEEDEALSDAMNADPDAAYEVMNRTEWQAASNLIVGNLLDEVKSKFDSSGLVSQGLAWAQIFVPLRDTTSVQTFDAVPDMAKAFFPGDTKTKMYAYISTLPPAEQKKIFRQYVDRELQSNNYLGAMSFLQGYLSYSSSDAFYDTLFAGVDVATLAPIGKLAKGLSGITKAVNVPAKEVEMMSAVSNMPTEAVKATFAKSLNNFKLPTHDINNVADAERTVLSLSRPQEMFNGAPLRAGAAATVRLEQAAVARSGIAMEILTNVNRVERLSPDEIAKGYEEATQFLEDNFVHHNNQILDVKQNAAEDNLGNVYSVSMYLGKKDGSSFPSEFAARTLANRIKVKTNDYKIVQMPDGGWAVKIDRYVDETSGGVRNLKIDTDNKLPDNIATRWLGHLAGADTLLSKGQTQARGVAVMSSEHVANLLEEFTKPLAVLGKKGRKELEEFISSDRDYVDPTRGRGRTRATVQEFEDAFHALHNKLPSVEQVDAYNAYKQLNDLDWMVRDLDIFKQKATMGIEKFSVRLKGEGDVLTDKAFEGKEIDDLPRGSKQPFSFAIIDDNGNIVDGQRYSSYSMSSKDWDNVNSLKERGYKVIQPFEGYTDIGDKSVNFILVKNFKRDRIGLKNLNYKEGSHVINKYGWYGKQPRVKIENGRAFYRGDQTLFNARTQDEARDIADKFETARKMVVNRTPGIKRYFEENLPMWTVKKFLKAVNDGAIDLKVPIKVVQSGQRSVTDGSSGFIDELRAEGNTVNSFHSQEEFNLSSRVTGRFLGERDEVSMPVYASEKGKIFELDTDPLLSPFDTLRYAMGNMVDTHVIHDYRIKSVRDFTKTYKDILSGSQSDFDTYGLDFIFEPKYIPNADPNLMRSAESQRRAILSLFNQKTWVERQIDAYKERIVRTIRSTAGDKVADYVQDSALPFASNLDVSLRAFAFHTKMGFFNIKQLWLQSTGAVNIMAISPKYGVYGAKAAWPLIAAINSRSKYIRGIGDKLSGVTGIKGDEFEELTRLYQRSGFYHVGGDVAYLDNLKAPDLTKSKIGYVLDLGTAPFKAGEGIVRSMAFATAYAERKALMKGSKNVEETIRLFRGEGDNVAGNSQRGLSAGRYFSTSEADAKKFAGPNGKVFFVDVPKSRMKEVILDSQKPSRWRIVSEQLANEKSVYTGQPLTTKIGGLTRADEAWILQRAKDLTGNMTRDSNAAFQKGYGAVVTQFMGYQLRLMEQFLSKKLTTAEKTRLFVGMSLMYGVPVATGMTLGVWPIRDWLRENLAKDGISYDNTLAEPFFDGFASTLIETITGKDYDLSGSYGPGGLSTFYDLLKGDSELTDILLGASGGVLWDTVMGRDGIVKFLGNIVNPDSTTFPVTASDLTHVLQNITSVDTAVKLWTAIKTGEWRSKNETTLTDVSLDEALTQSVLGINVQRVSDAFTQIDAMTRIRNHQTEVMKEVITEYKRGFEMLKEGFDKEGQTFISRAKAKGVAAGLSPNQWSTVYNRVNDDTPLDQSVVKSFERLTQQVSNSKNVGKE